MKRGVIFGAWDLLHAGHIFTLRDCKENCDHLTVCLQVDPSIQRDSKNRPVQTMFERWVQLMGCKYVDRIIPYEYEEDIINILTGMNFDVRFLGEDYKNSFKPITGKDIVPIVYLKRNHSYSSSELRERIKK